jgi:hypothetical protein
MKIKSLILGITMALGPAAQAQVPSEPEIIADINLARGHAYQILDLRTRTGEEHDATVARLVEGFARAAGVIRNVGYAWAPIWTADSRGRMTWLVVQPLGQEFDLPGARGGRLLVWSVRDLGGEASLVLDTTALAVGVDDHSTVAAIDDVGFRAYRWDGSRLQARP